MAWHVVFHYNCIILLKCGYICEYVQVNIACAFTGVIASVGVSLLSVAHPLWENILGTGYTPMDDSHSRSRGLRKPTCDWYSSFSKNFGKN